jgi:hypothetical protein
MICSFDHAMLVYSKNNFNNIGLHMLNQLPHYLKEISVLYKFKNSLISFLLDHRFYSLNEFFLHEKWSLVKLSYLYIRYKINSQYRKDILKEWTT